MGSTSEDHRGHSDTSVRFDELVGVMVQVRPSIIPLETITEVAGDGATLGLDAGVRLQPTPRSVGFTDLKGLAPMEDTSAIRTAAIVLAIVGSIALIALALSIGNDLEDRTWAVEELSIDGTMTPPLPGTMITAVFENGSVTGIAGCNNYFSAYEVNGDSLEIGPPGATLMVCAEPRGVMDQEGAYLSLFGSVDRFRIEDHTLTLYSDDEAVVIYHEVAVEHYN